MHNRPIIFKEVGRAPIKMWLDDIESGAMTQAIHLTQLPFLHEHVAIMPDSHQGYGMPIGGVVALKDTIIPNAVGVDIGCGMIAQPYDIQADMIPRGTLIEILKDVRELIPVGFNHHDRAQDNCFMPDRPYPDGGVVDAQYERARKQLGTLGGGNHFIELQKADDGRLWVMVHSGSRNVGLQVANHYNKVAINMREEVCSTIPTNWQLDYLPESHFMAGQYLLEMDWCVEFAQCNRQRMMDAIDLVLADKLGVEGYHNDPINIAHNYAAKEVHFGETVWVHRKGATRARANEFGIIPGSQGTCSYIVRGLGNKESFESCSHGAGRKMSRKKARQELNLQNEQVKMGMVIHSCRSKKDLDEAPGAYKDIDVVMENQKDLVGIVVKLEPLAVVKG
jgi:tRNA-splicing ligase RtcB